MGDTAHPGRQTAVATGQGLRLDLFVAGAFGLPRREARRLIGRGGAWIDDRRVRQLSQPVPAGARVTVCHPPEGAPLELELSEGDILFEDGSVLAVDKRPGWYVQPVPWDAEANVEAAVRRLLLRRSGQPLPLHLLHRLDRDTSGVLLFSLGAGATKVLHAQFVAGRVRKEYRAVVAGRLERPVEVDAPIGQGPGGRWVVSEGGRPASTLISPLVACDGATLIQAEPRTGRTHQVRIHCAGIGHPLIGDIQYGGPGEFRGRTVPRFLLHAFRLCFRHPADRREVAIESPLPAAFGELPGLSGS